MFNEKLDEVVAAIEKNYEAEAIAFNDPDRHFPNRKEVIQIITDLRRVMFPRFFGNEAPCGAGPKYFIGNVLTRVEENLHHEIREALLFEAGKGADVEAIDKRTSEICSEFFYALPALQETLLKDVEAAYEGDPAAYSKEEIIFSYPGFFAIFIYRIAHELYIRNVPLIPRIMTEYGHSETGVDLNAGATVGDYFFIDHATGVVIGETTVIGNHVKLYQGVTLGALSTRGGQALSGVKRHPTIEDDVTIYSNASVLGGDTVVGAGSVIGGSAFVTQSVPANSRVSLEGQKVSVRVRGEEPQIFEI